MGTPTISIPRLDAALDDPAAWRAAARVAIRQFHPQSSTPRPQATARCFHDGRSITLGFEVTEQFVVARFTDFMSPVWTDSCVEFFTQPREGGGYFNFEFNILGTLYSHFIEDWKKTTAGFEKSTPLTPAQGKMIMVHPSVTAPAESEIVGPLNWFLQVRIPLELIEIYTSPLGDLTGQTWRGNFYKCADDSSRPHWAAWADIGPELNFHKPHRFGALRFE